MKIKKNDIVKLLSGKDRNKTGKVIKVFPKSGKIAVEGLNIFKKHRRPRREGEKGEIVQVVRPVAVSNAQLVCPNCKQAARVGFVFEDAKKLRYCKKCQSRI